MTFTEPRRLAAFRRHAGAPDIHFTSTAFSPDGGRIAFAFDSRRGSAIGIMNSDGGHLTRLTLPGLTKSRRPRDDAYYDLWFTPDGAHIVYALSESDGEKSSICRVDVATAEQTRVTDAALHHMMRPTLSPDGQQIVCELCRKGGTNLCRIAANGGEMTHLTHTYHEQTGDPESHIRVGNQSPCYSPDGTQIAFVSSDYDGQAQHPFQVCVMRADGTGITRLTDLPDDCAAPVWHPDGKRIAFTAHAELDACVKRSKWRYRLNLHLVDTDGSGSRRLEDSNSVNRIGSFSPDGRHIVYCSSCDERFEEGRRNWDIRVLEVATGVIHKVTDDDLYDHDPRFSPDGLSIVFVSERDGFVGLFRSDVSDDAGG